MTLRYAALLALVFWAVLIALMLAGCAGVPALPADPATMTPEQLRAWSADRNLAISCATVTGMTSRGIVTHVVLDRGVVQAGSVSVDGDCRVKVEAVAK